MDIVIIIIIVIVCRVQKWCCCRRRRQSACVSLCQVWWETVIAGRNLSVKWSSPTTNCGPSSTLTLSLLWCWFGNRRLVAI